MCDINNLEDAEKTFILQAIYKDGKLASIHTKAKGVNGFEIIGLLQVKIMEINAQAVDSERVEFNTKRIFTTEEAEEYLKEMKQKIDK